MRRLSAAWLLLVLPALLAPGAAATQTVRGLLVQADTGDPVPGAFVVLVDAGGEDVRGVLSDGAGRFLLRAPAAGRYTLRTDRIGFESTVSEPLELREGATLDFRLEVPTRAIELEAIRVESRPRCSARPGAGARTARLWEEARKALQATHFTDAGQVYRFQISGYERILDPDARRIRDEQRVTRWALSSNPIRSLPADELAARGWVRPVEDGEGSEYSGPDARVLLSDGFLDTHCFHAVPRDERTGLVGLGFEPAPGRRLPDIRGVLWLDPETAELRTLEYRYTELPHQLGEDPRFGGTVEFERLPSGAWIVRRWAIRMPRLARDITFDTFGPTRSEPQLIAIEEEGAEIIRIRSFAGAEVSGTPGATLTGVVYDSIDGRPLEDATVYLSGTQYAASTGPDGRFRINGIRQGRYAAAFTHRRLEALGVYPGSRTVDLEPGGVAEIELGVPSLASILAAACPTTERPDTLGTVIGTVRDAATGRPLPGADVILQITRWDILNEDRPASMRAAVVVKEMPTEYRTTTDRDGHYRVCGLPAGWTISARATRGERSSRAVLFQLHERDLVRRDFDIGRPETR